MGEGFTIMLQTRTTDATSPTCLPIQASTSPNVGGVMLGETGEAGITAIDPGVQATYPRATAASGCHGVYRLGLNDEDDGVLRGYRYFSTGTPTECATAGFNVSADQSFCWDSWRVTVKDSQGNVVATSIE